MSWPSSTARPSAKRIALGRLASQIYNDTGLRSHQKKQYADAQALFTKAVYADRTFPLAAYNLACALARQSAPTTEAALRHAATLSPTVYERARKDADFAAFRDAAWLH